jgi:hypothetical protein
MGLFFVFGAGSDGNSIHGWASSAHVRFSPSDIDDQESAMKAPGGRAKTGGKKLTRGAAVQVVCYPRPITKAMLVHASHMANRSLSSFMILASLKEAAAIKGCSVEDLIPSDELEQYARVRLGKGEACEKFARTH